ncbi:hypothetical protein CPB85DRAFT_1342751 [Mucidula mucida]|nr:hypothetical protein CPB85DRAFT_1361042 [Mucidula mucida]KAF8878350.1 hypothetical protein CPB85DRAFT_1342751 [Mucidula mucida]
MMVQEVCFFLCNGAFLIGSPLYSSVHIVIASELRYLSTYVLASVCPVFHFLLTLGQLTGYSSFYVAV